MATKKKCGCPKAWKGRPVKRVKGGGCMAKLTNGRSRFVKKLACR
jgi:hypothetical protein